MIKNAIFTSNLMAMGINAENIALLQSDKFSYKERPIYMLYRNYAISLIDKVANIDDTIFTAIISPGIELRRFFQLLPALAWYCQKGAV